MGALPKKKLSSSRRGKRYATKNYTPPSLTVCPDCGKLKRGHTLCPNCGVYRGRSIKDKVETVKVTKVKSEDKE